jgi:hypothetical protein
MVDRRMLDFARSMSSGIMKIKQIPMTLNAVFGAER